MRTLVRGTNWIGDSVMSLAALKELRRLLPDDQITLLARRWVSGLFEGQGLVDDIVHTEEVGEKGLDLFRSRHHLRGFDRVILFPNAFRPALQAFLIGAPERVGYNTDGRQHLLTRTGSPRIRRLKRHQIYYYLDLLYQTGLSSRDYLNDHDYRPDIRLTPQAEWTEAADQLLLENRIRDGAPLVTINPGAFFGTAKRWFPERYAALADRLIGEFQAEVVVVGSKGELPIAERIRAGTTRHVHVLTGQTTLGTLLGILARTRCFITNDSGPMHLGAALNVPQVALFGSTDEIATGPYSSSATVIHKHVECSPCLLRECPIDLRCFGTIQVDEVFRRACSLMNHG